jgi:hypothetical protein
MKVDQVLLVTSIKICSGLHVGWIPEGNDKAKQIVCLVLIAKGKK